MLFDPAAEALFRRFEMEVLDVHHRTLPLWARPRGTALYAILSAFDARMPLILGTTETVAARHRAAVRFKDVEEGLSYAVRWLHEASPTVAVVPTDDQAILGEADEFLVHAADYATLVEHHVRYGRGLLGLEVDAEARTVRFRFRADLPFEYAFLGMIENIEYSARRAGRIGREIREVAAEAIALLQGISYHHDRRRLVIDDLSVLNRPQVRSFLQALLSAAETMIPEKSDLGGFTMGQFRAFWDALVRWSFACLILYLETPAHGMGSNGPIPTQVIPRETFAAAMMLLSGLALQVVEAIVGCLRYDGSSPRSDVYLTPLFSDEASVAWSPLVILRSRSERNLLKLMAREKTLKAVADNLIGGRERGLLNQFGSHLAGHGYAYKLTTELSHRGEAGELDMLAYNTRSPEELLLVEAKSILAADEINEVDAATTELVRAQGQLRRTIEILGRMPTHQKAGLFKFVRWENVTHYYGMVLTPDTHPNERYDHSEIPAISLDALCNRLTRSDFRRPRMIWEACRARRWFSGRLQPTEATM